MSHGKQEQQQTLSMIMLVRRENNMKMPPYTHFVLHAG